ncbi:hypothetical protein LEMLEM_LOCUS9121, partial [Lemmus lemmus]
MQCHGCKQRTSAFGTGDADWARRNPSLGEGRAGPKGSIGAPLSGALDTAGTFDFSGKHPEYLSGHSNLVGGTSKRSIHCDCWE